MAETRPKDLHIGLLRITVLMCGAIGMILELAGSRLLAPFFGNGLFVWTALIGIMLGFMSVGNFLGGRLGDRRLDEDVLFWILAGSSAGIAVIAFTEPLVLPRLAEAGSLRMAAVTASVALFAIPCTLLGMVTPYSTRYAIRSLDHSGATVGTLYALGTLGSIIGTFLGGFYIIATVGSHNLIGWLALAVGVIAVAFAKRHWSRLLVLAAIGLLVTAALSASASALESIDTGYDRYFVTEEVDPNTGRSVRIIARDYDSMESAVFMDTGEPYLFDYYRYYDLALSAAEREEPVRRTLLIGGGTFSYPRHQLRERPSSSTDVVEIDPRLVDVAKKDFFLAEDPRLRIFVEDGRTFLNSVTDRGRKADPRYDVVLIDAFKSANSIPYQLTTRESLKMASDAMDDDGILVMNIIASPAGAGSRFVAAELKTIKSVFPEVELYAVFDVDPTEPSQNISIIASKRKGSNLAGVLAELSPELTARRLDPAALPQDVEVLTDDFAPVDQYLMAN